MGPSEECPRCAANLHRQREPGPARNAIARGRARGPLAGQPEKGPMQSGGRVGRVAFRRETEPCGGWFRDPAEGIFQWNPGPSPPPSFGDVRLGRDQVHGAMSHAARPHMASRVCQRLPALSARQCSATDGCVAVAAFRIPSSLSSPTASETRPDRRSDVRTSDRSRWRAVRAAERGGRLAGAQAHAARRGVARVQPRGCSADLAAHGWTPGLAPRSLKRGLLQAGARRRASPTHA